MDKRILIITRNFPNFPPLVGGMERLIWNVFNQLKDQFSCTVIGPAGCRAHISGEHHAIECPISPVSMFLALSLLKSIRLGLTQKYNLCIAGSGLTAPVAVLMGKLSKCPTLTFTHGLDIIAESKCYQKLFIPAIRQSSLVIANSQNTARLAMIKGIHQDRIQVLFPGIQLHQREKKHTRFRQQHQLAGKDILLSVGRLVPRKGHAEFLKYSFPAIIKERPDVVYVIIGSEPDDALKKGRGVLDEIQSVIHERKLENRVLILGHVDEPTLTSAYYESDLLIFPARDISGDVEGFGMVAVEAAACGLPTVAFAVGGIPDAVADRRSGFLIMPNDYDTFAKVTVSYLQKSIPDVNSERCIHFAGQFSWDIYGQRLRDICSQAIAQKENLAVHG